MNKEKHDTVILQEAETPEEEHTQLIERPDGFYWQNQVSGELFGPFATLLEAMEDTQYRDDDEYDEGALLQEVGDEIGIAGWVDADTGELAEGSPPRLSDQ